MTVHSVSRREHTSKEHARGTVVRQRATCTRDTLTSPLGRRSDDLSGQIRVQQVCICISFCRVFVDCLAAKRLASVYRCLTYCVVYRRPRFPAGAPKRATRRSRASPARVRRNRPDSGVRSSSHITHSTSHDTRPVTLRISNSPRRLGSSLSAARLTHLHAHTHTHTAHTHTHAHATHL